MSTTMHSWLGRALASLIAAAGVAVIAAVALAVIDLYLVGHGLGTIRGPLADWPALGVHVSPADVILLSAAALAAVGTWLGTAWLCRLERRPRQGKEPFA
jgi:hypothetical protein